MKKNIIILSVLCVMLLTGCSTDYAKVCQENIEEYNKKQVKRAHQRSLARGSRIICTLTVDKKQKRVMRNQTGRAYYNSFAGRWEVVFLHECGKRKVEQNEEVTLSGEEPLTAARI